MASSSQRPSEPGATGGKECIFCEEEDILILFLLLLGVRVLGVVVVVVVVVTAAAGYCYFCCEASIAELLWRSAANGQSTSLGV